MVRQQETERETETDLLRNYLAALNDEEADRLLDRLLSELAANVVRPTLGRRLRFFQGGFNVARQEAEDLCHEILLKLLKRFRRLRAYSDTGTLYDVRGYAASIAYNACFEYLREKFPARTRLKNKLRYLLGSRDAFAVWEDEGGVLRCGLREWRNAGAAGGKIAELVNQPSSLRGKLAQNLLTDEARLGELLRELFRIVGAPVDLDELVGLVGTLTGVQERNDESLDEQVFRLDTTDGEGTSLAKISAAPNRKHHGGAQIRLEERENLRQLWEEIKLLPVRQRNALLLNLKDGNGNAVVTFLPLTRTATIREIAAALEIETEEFARLWNELPLEDLSIAERLGATRQQVINLRKSARERLARRFQQP